MEASMLTNHSAGVNNPIRLGLSQTQFENEVTSSGILTTAEGNSTSNHSMNQPGTNKN